MRRSTNTTSPTTRNAEVDGEAIEPMRMALHSTDEHFWSEKNLENQKRKKLSFFSVSDFPFSVAV
jgi:hypothetical protein